MQSLIKKYAGQEKEILTRHEAIGLMNTMDFYNIRCYNSYFNLISHCKEVIGNGHKGGDDKNPLREAVIQACREDNPTFDIAILDALVHRLEEVEAGLESKLEAKQKRIDFLEFQLNARKREVQKKAIKILGCEV